MSDTFNPRSPSPIEVDRDDFHSSDTLSDEESTFDTTARYEHGDPAGIYQSSDFEEHELHSAQEGDYSSGESIEENETYYLDDENDNQAVPQVRFISSVRESNYFQSLRTPPPSASHDPRNNPDILATPRLNKGNHIKDPDYAEKILLEMDRKYAEMDVKEFLDTFVPAKRLTKSQLKKPGDFSGLELGRRAKESAMYPVIVRLSHTGPRI